MTSADRSRADGGTGAVELAFLDPDGIRRRWSVTPGPVTVEADGTPIRVLTTTGGVDIRQRYLPLSSSGGRPPTRRLENEVRIGLRLLRRYPVAYPAILSRLIGYDIDSVEPFVLHAMPPGEPCALHAGRLALAPLGAFQRGLVHGLELLAAAGVVHGELGPDTVRWDGRTVQIDDFGGASVVGERRSGPRRCAWASPEQTAGTGRASASDDVWSAGLVIFHVATGRPVGQAGAPDLEDRGAALRSVLDHVFEAEVAMRPTAQVLATRLGAVPPVPPVPVEVTEEEQAMDRGRRAYDAALREKWPPPVAGAPPSPPASARRPPWGWVVAAVLFAAAVAAIWVLL